MRSLLVASGQRSNILQRASIILQSRFGTSGNASGILPTSPGISGNPVEIMQMNFGIFQDHLAYWDAPLKYHKAAPAFQETLPIDCKESLKYYETTAAYQDGSLKNFKAAL